MKRAIVLLMVSSLVFYTACSQPDVESAEDVVIRNADLPVEFTAVETPLEAPSEDILVEPAAAYTFVNDREQITGRTYDADTFDIQNLLELETGQADADPLPEHTLNGIGDRAAGMRYTTQMTDADGEPYTAATEAILFDRGLLLVFVAVSYEEGAEPSVSVYQLARILDTRANVLTDQ